MPDAVIVVPCFDEEKRLPVAEFRTFAEANPGVRFLMVDDGSRDGTRQILERLEREKPSSFEVLSLPRNRGKAEAVRQGMLLAFAEEPFSAGYWDADLATPLREIPRFLEILRAGRALIVFGARIKLMGRAIDRRASRHYAGRVFATLASLCLDLPVYDTQCGAKLFRNLPETRALFREPFLSNWVFDVEILARLIAMARDRGDLSPERVLIEQPLEAWCHVPGSKVGPADFLRSIVELGRIRRRYLRPGRRQR